MSKISLLHSVLLTRMWEQMKAKTKGNSKQIVVFSIVVWLAIVGGLAACNSDSSQPTQVSPTPTAASTPGTQVTPTPSPAVDGATVLNTRCLSCHGLSRIANGRRTRAQWEQFVTGHDAQLTAAEKAALVDYLAQTYGL